MTAICTVTFRDTGIEVARPRGRSNGTTSSTAASCLNSSLKVILQQLAAALHLLSLSLREGAGKGAEDIEVGRRGVWGRDGWRMGRRRQTRAMQGWLGLSGTSDSGRCITSDISIPADSGLHHMHTRTHTHTNTHTYTDTQIWADWNQRFGPSPGTGGNDCHPFPISPLP